MTTTWVPHSRKHPLAPCARAGRIGASSIIEWDVFTWSRALSFWRSHARGSLVDAKVLEIGARDGGLTHWLVHEGAFEVTATDVGFPTERAAISHRDYIQSGRVRHESLDATRITQTGEYDVVVFKSVLGSIGGTLGRAGQAAAIEGMLRALRPGGILLWAENLAASPMHEAARRQWVPWADRWLYPTLAELRRLLMPFSSTEWSSAGFTAAFGRTESQRRLLASLDAAVLEWVVPREWNYVAFGVSRKGRSPAEAHFPGGEPT